MTFEEIDARYGAAVPTLESGNDEWDDPESAPEEDDDELGYRNVDEEGTYDETGDQGEDA
jgi:hypothetical protein